MSCPTPGLGPSLPPFTYPHKPASQSRRLQQRFRRACRVVDIANGVRSGLEWLSGRPDDTVPLYTPFFSPESPSYLSPLSQPATKMTPTSVERRLHDVVWDASASFDRRTAPLFASGDEVADYVPTPLPPLLPGSYVGSSPPRHVVATRISLPTARESINFLDLLPPEHRELYASPAGGLLEDNPPAKVPNQVFLCEDEEYIPLLLRMKDLDMLNWLELSEAKSFIGMFGVAKSTPEEDRLIGDARRTNVLHVKPPKVELPSPEAVSCIKVPKGRKVAVAKCDLSVFFYGLRIPDWLVPYFCWPAVRRSAVGLPGEGWVVPAFNRLCMGWSHAPRVAQLCHLYVMSQGPFHIKDALLGNNDFHLRPGRVRWLVYIDDCVLIGLSREEVEHQLQRLMDLYRRFGLRVKESKVVHATFTPVEVLGLEFDGTKLTVGLSAVKMAKLLLYTDFVLGQGKCSGRDMEQLVGRWVWAALVRRPLLACFQAVYRFAKCAGNKTYHLWPSVAAELRALVQLAPLCLCKLPQHAFPKVVATDASNQGMAVVSLEAPKVPPLNDIMARRWSTAIRHPWRWPLVHINHGELSAVSVGLRWVISHPSSLHSWVFLICDSQVVCAILRKGRTSSYRLLLPLRRLWAWVLAADLHPSTMWVPTHLMPADEPSRNF